MSNYISWWKNIMLFYILVNIIHFSNARFFSPLFLCLWCVEQRERTGKMKLRDLAGYFHLPISEASKEMNICPSAIKSICRKGGLLRWPHRKVAPLCWIHACYVLIVLVLCTCETAWILPVFADKEHQEWNIKEAAEFEFNWCQWKSACFNRDTTASTKTCQFLWSKCWLIYLLAWSLIFPH